MVAVPDTAWGSPADVSVLPPDEEPVAGRRVVAVAISPMELLRPGSDLVRAIGGAGYVDLLLACEDEPVADPSPVCVLGGGAFAVAHTRSAHAVDQSVDGDDTDGGDDEPDVAAELRAVTAGLGLDEVHLHRLALPSPLGAAAEPDLVAALSELVGFDPEPGVRVLAPVPGDPERNAIDRAARRIAEVYGLPLQRYRCLELSVVETP
jgi:hypothetical protein